MSASKPLQKLMLAARSGGMFLLTVGAITVALTAVYKARAVLDADAALYAAGATAKSTETHPMSAIYAATATASSAEAHPMPEAASTAILLGVDANMPASEPPPASTTSRDARTDAREVQDEQPDVTSSIGPGRPADARFTTIYIHRGAEPPAAYVVPRE